MHVLSTVAAFFAVPEQPDISPHTMRGVRSMAYGIRHTMLHSLTSLSTLLTTNH